MPTLCDIDWTHLHPELELGGVAIFIYRGKMCAENVSKTSDVILCMDHGKEASAFIIMLQCF